jgi:putative sigma-54 modulation protein
MELKVTSRNAEVSDYLRQYITKKLHKLERYLPETKEVDVELTSHMSRNLGEQHVAQATVRANRAILRAEVQAADQFEAIDGVLAKLQRQVERYKGKRHDRWRGRGVASIASAATAEVESVEGIDEDESDATAPVVRRKRFPVYPMHEAEAIEQMELLGHDFYLYQSAATGQINVVYRRKDGGYGIIDPEVA